MGGSKLHAETRERLARRRLLNILGRHGVANSRTLEQKIADAGPTNQRIDPHVMGPVRKAMIKEGIIIPFDRHGGQWYRLATTPDSIVQARLEVLAPIWDALGQRNFGIRMGQTLEIATHRALSEKWEALGAFSDLDNHDDSTRYSKEEPPSYWRGKLLPNGQRLDFMARHDAAGWLGIECKNVREWLYPDRDEVKALLNKCIALDLVPVLIARRIHYVTFKLLQPCGVILHQTYNQLFPTADVALADQARHKDLLGYHDIRTGNIPDARMQKFIGVNLGDVAADARDRFEAYKDLLAGFADGTLPYKSFAARVRRRQTGLDEDFDPRLDPADWE